MKSVSGCYVNCGPGGECYSPRSRGGEKAEQALDRVREGSLGVVTSK